MEYHDPGALPGSVIFRASPSPAARELFLFPTFVGHYFCNGNYKVERSTFDSFLLMYICSGSGFVSSQGRMVPVAEGDLVLMDCFRPHRYYTRVGWETRWVHFDGPLAEKYFRYIRDNRLLIRPCGATSVPRRFDTLLNFYEQQTSPDEAVLSKLLTDLLTELMLPTDEEPQNQQQLTVIEESLRYIEENLGGDLSLDSLARHAMLSPFHFSRIFKEETGFSPHQYLIAVRVDYARYLLRSGSLPTKEIAYRCGFSSSAAFCTCFKKIMGQSPGDYRRQL